jgi:hypothetical protein
MSQHKKMGATIPGGNDLKFLVDPSITFIDDRALGELEEIGER